MNQQFCYKCHLKIGSGEESGIRHQKTASGYTTSYLCKACSNTHSMETQRISRTQRIFDSEFWQPVQEIWHPDPEEQEPKRNWQGPGLGQKQAKKQAKLKKDPGEKAWLEAWFDNYRQLSPLFLSFKKFRSFAGSYGYRPGDAKDIARAKQNKDEEKR